jgi:hypothetical protein
MSETTVGHVVLVNESQAGKATTASEAFEALATMIAETLTLNLGALSTPYTVPYNATEGQAKPAIRNIVWKLTGSPAGAFVLIHPATKHLFVVNNTTAQAVTVKCSGQTGVALAATEKRLCYCNGTDVEFIEITASGATGATGATGSAGAAGTNGSIWYNGAGTPSGGTGANGDYYLNLTNGDVYQKAAGAWGTAVGNIKGATGTTGAAGGTTLPDGTTVGDMLRWDGDSWAAEASPYMIPFFLSSKPASNALVLQHVATNAFTLPVSLTGSQGYAATVSSGVAAFTLKKNSTEIGTATFAISTATATFSMAAPITFAAGDRFILISPVVQDTTLANVSLTFLGKRG